MGSNERTGRGKCNLHDMSGSLLFAGTNGGGVFGSSDNGTSWHASNNGLEDGEVISLAARRLIHFRRNKKQRISLGENHGITWNPFNEGLVDTWVSDFAFKDSNLFVGTFFAGVFRTTLSGEHWTKCGGMYNCPNVAALIVRDRFHFYSTK